MLKPNDLPLLCLPVDLSDKAAAKLVAFLYDLTEALESHYYAPITRHYRATHHAHHDLDTSSPADPTDPPF